LELLINNGRENEDELEEVWDDEMTKVKNRDGEERIKGWRQNQRFKGDV